MSSGRGRALLNLYVPTAIIGFGQGMVVPTIPALAQVHGVPAGLAAQVITAHLLGRFLALLPGGALVDHYGPRLALYAGPLLVAASALATAAAPSFLALLAAQVVGGIGAMVWQVGREVAAVDLVRQDQRGRAMSAFFGVSSAAIAFGPVLGGAIADATDVRVVFLVYAVLAAGVTLAARSVPATPRVRPAGPRRAFTIPRLAEIDRLYRVTYLVLMVGTFAASLRQSVLSSLLPLYVVGDLRYSSTQVGLLFGIVGVVNMLMIGPAGYISDRYGRKAATVPTAALGAVAFALYPLATTLPALMALSVVVGVASGFGLGSMTTYAYDIVPSRTRGQFQGLRRSAGDAGSISGPVLGGLIAETAGTALAFLAFAPLHATSALLLLFVARESLRRRVSR